MDSLLANYASSEDEEEHQQQQPQKPIPSKTTSSSSSFFSALPQPKSSSSSLFQSLPPPKQPSSDTLTDTRSSALPNLTETSSLPKPKSQFQEKPKRVVQFKPPIIPLPKPTKHEDSEDEDDEEEERNRRRKLESSTQAPSVKSFLSSIPAPRNSATLGVQASSASGRRSIIETDSPAPPPPAASSSGGSASESNVSVDQNGGDYENYQYPIDQYNSYGNYSWGAIAEAEAGADVGTGTAMANYSYGNNHDAYASHGAYGNYGQYANNWDEGSVATVPETPVSSSDSILKFAGKRGRKDVPVEVIEVKQDELMKNRPREDQVKLTGLAFGPTYQVLSRFVLFYLAFLPGF